MSTAEELKDQGIKEFMQRDYEHALTTFHQAVEAFEAENKPDMAAEMNVNLGLTLHSLGQHEEALEAMSRGHAYFAQINDRTRIAQALGNMARVYAKLGNSEQAITNYREASALFLELEDEESYGQTVLAIADLQFRTGQRMQAMATYEVGLEHIKHPNARQKVMKGLLGVRNRMTGMGVIKDDESPQDE
ncbi:MAG TPA: tetratricopeptide repeat protein [Aggregatilineaceae bacterium]|nr:tetratricopeptide repeat protein [Aggregatilineaceae bacterium]